jgi:hypothetical protein
MTYGAKARTAKKTLEIFFIVLPPSRWVFADMFKDIRYKALFGLLWPEVSQLSFAANYCAL